MRNFRLILSYDGTRYDGWQKQGNTNHTIQEKIETALSRMLGQTVEAAGSGRTDAGAHAREQVVSFHAETDKPCEELLDELRRYLPEDIGAMSLEDAYPRFHARLACKGKTYVYRLWNSISPNVFERKYVYSMTETLDIAAMERAAALLSGTHDFLAFCSNRHIKKSTVRTVESIGISRVGEEVQFTLSGDGFLYNMVRIIVGTLLEVGQGKRTPEEMKEILASLDRQKAGPTVPAQGLILWEVRY